MRDGRIGIAIQESNPTRLLDLISHAEALGAPAVWLTTGVGRPDAMIVYTAAALRTRTIRFGTCIVPTFPRHPFVVAQQTADISQLAPGRLRLGVGPSHRPTIEGVFGIPHRRPLEHLREFVTIVKTALATGAVDFEGAHFRVRGRLAYSADVPVLISALQAGSFELAGRLADGAISWISPAPYLRDVALPALERGARAAGRPTPPLVGHAFVAVSEDSAAVERTAQERLTHYLTLRFYLGMFRAAGFPEAESGRWSPRMLKAVVLHGDEAAVAEQVRAFVSTSGASEMIAAILPVGPDLPASTERTMQLLAKL